MHQINMMKNTEYNSYKKSFQSVANYPLADSSLFIVNMLRESLYAEV